MCRLFHRFGYHKKVIAFCEKEADGRIVGGGLAGQSCCPCRMDPTAT